MIPIDSAVNVLFNCMNWVLSGYGHVARLGSDASLAHPDDGMLPAKTADGSTAAARLAFVARLIGVEKYGQRVR